MKNNKITEVVNNCLIIYGEIIRQRSRDLKWLNVFLNAVLFFLVVPLLRRSIDWDYSIALFSDKNFQLLIFTIIYSISNTTFLLKNKSKNLDKIVSQNFMYSAFLLVVSLSYVEERSFVFQIASSFIGLVALWRSISPYLNNYENPIKKVDFIRVFIGNLGIVIYGSFYDYTGQIDTLRFPIWFFMFIGTTFWQLYYLDIQDEFPVIGDKLNRIAKKVQNSYHTYYPARDKKVID